jgi:hypothetical protein
VSAQTIHAVGSTTSFLVDPSTLHRLHQNDGALT